MLGKSDFRRLERVVRGFSNHRRIQILDLLDAEPALSVAAMGKRLGVHFKTISAHSRRLEIAGLVVKQPVGASVVHRITRRGKAALAYLRQVE